MKRTIILATAALIGLAACDRDDHDDGPVYNTHDNVVETNDADECPRADGQPCR